MLALAHRHWMAMVREAVTTCPLEGCGLLVGEPGGNNVVRFESITNDAASERMYRLDELDYLKVAMQVEDEGLDIIGVMHSHPVTPAVPSEHDTATATGVLIPASWHWVIVSLAGPVPVVRSYRRRGPQLIEEPIKLVEQVITVSLDGAHRDFERSTDSAQENRSSSSGLGGSSWR